NLNSTLSACCAPSYTLSFLGAAPSFLTLSPSGVLTGALITPGVYHFLVKAQDATNSSNFCVRLITLTVTPLNITPNSLPYGNVGTTYSQILSITGGTGTVAWSVSG